jgi:hypothetical protein
MTCATPPIPPTDGYPEATEAGVVMPLDLAAYYAARDAYADQLRACLLASEAHTVALVTEAQALRLERDAAWERVGLVDLDLHREQRRRRVVTTVALVAVPAALTAGIYAGARAAR